MHWNEAIVLTLVLCWTLYRRAEQASNHGRYGLTFSYIFWLQQGAMPSRGKGNP